MWLLTWLSEEKRNGKKKRRDADSMWVENYYSFMKCFVAVDSSFMDKKLGTASFDKICLILFSSH